MGFRQNATIQSDKKSSGSVTSTEIRRKGHMQYRMQSTFWLHAGDRISFNLASLAFQCVHGIAQNCLSADLRHAVDMPGRCHLRSASSMQLFVPRTRLSSIGDRAFQAARIWNSLLASVVTATTLKSFKTSLKTHLFSSVVPIVNIYVCVK